jgi:DivIVA domain-containing protein
MNNVQFTPKDILEKSFNQKMRGYDPNEVDTFLDGIIKDYQSYEGSVNKLLNENNQLKAEIKQLKQQQNQATVNQSMADQAKHFSDTEFNTEQHEFNPTRRDYNGSDVENELLKRVSNLEKRVFGTTNGPSSLDGQSF